MILLLLTAAAYFYFHWQYFTLVKRGSTKELFLLYFPDQNRLCVVEDYV